MVWYLPREHTTATHCNCSTIRRTAIAIAVKIVLRTTGIQTRKHYGFRKGNAFTFTLNIPNISNATSNYSVETSHEWIFYFSELNNFIGFHSRESNI